MMEAQWEVRAPGGACVTVRARSAVEAAALALDEAGLIGDPDVVGRAFEVRPGQGGPAIEVVIGTRPVRGGVR